MVLRHLYSLPQTVTMSNGSDRGTKKGGVRAEVARRQQRLKPQVRWNMTKKCLKLHLLTFLLLSLLGYYRMYNKTCYVRLLYYYYYYYSTS